MSDWSLEAEEGARVGRIGSDRMAVGLSSIPDSERGDLESVRLLLAENEKLKEVLKWAEVAAHYIRDRAECEQLQSAFDTELYVDVIDIREFIPPFLEELEAAIDALREKP